MSTVDHIGPGIHALSEDTYHSDPCETPSLSASIARVLVQQSPAHAWAAHPRLNPNHKPREDEKFDVGKVAHRMLLEGSTSGVEIVEADDWRTTAAKEQRDAARSAGLIPLLAKHYTTVEELAARAIEEIGLFAGAPPLFSGGMPERTLVWDEDGVTCRARLDWLFDDHSVIDDLKTTSKSANPETWSRTVYSMGYDVQAAFYRRGVRALTGVTPDFRLVVVETTEPYALSVISLDPAGLALADEKAQVAIDVWRDCLARDSWPGYPRQVCFAELPGWEEARWLDRDGMRDTA